MIYLAYRYYAHDCAQRLGIFSDRVAAFTYIDSQPDEEVLPPMPEYGLSEKRIPLYYGIEAYELDALVPTSPLAR